MKLSPVRISFTLVTVISLLCISCSRENATIIPENVLSKEKFEEILFDMSLAEAAININVKNVKPEKMDSVYAFDPLKENNVSRAEYDTSLHFYSAHPELYKEVYDKVLERLSEFEAKSVGADSTKK